MCIQTKVQVFNTNQKWIINLLTLYNVLLRTARNLLETRKNVKISTHPFYHTNLDWFSWEWSNKKIFFEEKNAFFVILGCFCPYVRQPHDHIGWATSMPFASINPTNPRTNLWNFRKKILRIGDFEKSAILNFIRLNFLFFCFILMKISPNLYGRLDELKF